MSDVYYIQWKFISKLIWDINSIWVHTGTHNLVCINFKFCSWQSWILRWSCPDICTFYLSFCTRLVAKKLLRSTSFIFDNLYICFQTHYAQYSYPITFTVSVLAPSKKCFWIFCFCFPFSNFLLWFCLEMASPFCCIPSIAKYLFFPWTVQWEIGFGRIPSQRPASQGFVKVGIWGQMWRKW